MIHEITMYCGECDNCGEHWENGDGLMAYHEKQYVAEGMDNSEWRIMDDGKTYCRNCYEIDDEDNIVIKEKDFVSGARTSD